MNVKQISDAFLWMNESMRTAQYGEISLRLVIHAGEVVRLFAELKPVKSRIVSFGQSP